MNKYQSSKAKILFLIHLEEQELHTLQLKLNKGNGLE